MHERQEIVIPLNFFGESNWSLRIVRENRSSHIEFNLHWGNKIEPTHAGLEPIEELKSLLERMLGEQVST